MTNQYLPTNINSPKFARLVDSNTEVRFDDQILVVSSAGGPRTVTLPDARTIPAFEIIIKAPNGATNSVTVVGQAGQTIDGGPAAVLATDGASALLVSDGVGWQTVGGGEAAVGPTPTTIQTTNATPTTIAICTGLPVDGMVVVKSEVLAGNEFAERMVMEVTARANIDAGVSSVLTTQNDFTSQDDSGWDVNVVASGSDVLVQVTGDSSTIDWEAITTCRTITTASYLPPGINIPTFTPTLALVLGPAWIGYPGLTEDDVVILQLNPGIDSGEAFYSEDGTLTPTPANRMYLRMYASENSTGSNSWYVYGYVGDTTSMTSWRSFSTVLTTGVYYLYTTQVNPNYDLGAVFATNQLYGVGGAWGAVFKSLTPIP